MKRARILVVSAVVGAVLGVAMGGASCSGNECPDGADCVLPEPDAGPAESPQYSYPDCGDASVGICDSDQQVLYCAASDLADKHGACSTNTDCALVPIDAGCSSLDSVGCGAGFAVAAAQADAFRDALAGEIAAFCGASEEKCVAGCVPKEGTLIAACRNSRCVVSDVQSEYTYAGCNDAGTYGCPNDLVFNCALEQIEAKHGGCQSDTDCVAVDFDTCQGNYTCTPAVVSDAGAFLAEANIELDRYCDGGPCRSFATCANGRNDYQPRCIQNRCRPELIDGGTADAGP